MHTAGPTSGRLSERWSPKRQRDIDSTAGTEETSTTTAEVFVPSRGQEKPILSKGVGFFWFYMAAPFRTGQCNARTPPMLASAGTFNVRSWRRFLPHEVDERKRR